MKSMSLLVLAWIATTGLALARPLFSDGFNPPSIEPLFPPSGHTFTLPASPTATQLDWLMSELAAGETTTLAEINDHFTPDWLAQISAEQTQAFIHSLRTGYPNAVIRDVVAHTPMQATVVIAPPGAPPPWGFLTINARYTGTQRIYGLGVSGWLGNTIYPEHRTLTLTQAADRFTTLSPDNSLLVGRINRTTGACSAVIERSGNTPRALGSIFKTYVLGGVARMIADDSLSATTPIAMVTSEIVQGSTINIEPINTVFNTTDMAVLMMGISDNTATDLLHERIGRNRANTAVGQLGMNQPALLTPLLSINEQFHLFRSFPLATALTYVNGTEAFQHQFLNEQIVPLGPVTLYPYSNIEIYASGSWQASPFDICRAFSALRRLPQGSEALAVVDAAFGASTGQPNVREDFDRVWYKGGSLMRASNNFDVLSHAWMLEDAGQDPYVIVALSNNATASSIDEYQVQSVTGRLLELVSQHP